jgi:RNA polymerase sigma-70 factor (ECF subfamily)
MSDDPKPVPRGADSTSLTLLQRARAQDAEAWERMHRLYRPFVLYWCSRKGVKGEDCDDVAQEVFRVASLGLEKFRLDRPGDSFRGWLRGITRNMVLEHFRRTHRGVQAVGGSDALWNLHQVPDAELERDEDDSVEELSQLHRRALEMVRCEFEDRTWQMFYRTTIEGASPKEVADEMGVSSAAVRQAKSRILRRLKEEVGDILD